MGIAIPFHGLQSNNPTCDHGTYVCTTVDVAHEKGGWLRAFDVGPIVANFCVTSVLILRGTVFPLKQPIAKGITFMVQVCSSPQGRTFGGEMLLGCIYTWRRGHWYQRMNVFHCLGLRANYREPWVLSPNMI